MSYQKLDSNVHLLPEFIPGVTRITENTTNLSVPYIFKIKSDNFLRVADNPRQRNTIERLKAAIKKHLKVEHPSHYVTSIIHTPKGDYKGDAHTRGQAWTDNLLLVPDYIVCLVYALDGIKEVKELYGCFDSSAAAETGNDRLYSGFKMLLGRDLNPDSKFLWSRGAKTGLEIAVNKNRSISENGLLSLDVDFPGLKNAIDIIDTHNQKFLINKFTAPCIAALICSVMRDGRAALPFWEDFQNEAYVRPKKNRIEAVEMLVKYTEEIRIAPKLEKGDKTLLHDCLQGTGRPESGFYAPRFLWIYQAWLQNKDFPTNRKRTVYILDGYSIADFMNKELV